MRTAWLVFVVTGFIAGDASAEGVDKEKLRKLVELPKLTFNWGFCSKTLDDHSTLFYTGASNRRFDASDEITKLQKQLTGGFDDAPRHVHLGALQSAMGQLDHAKHSYVKAVDIYRKRVQQGALSGGLLADFGEALCLADQTAEAESILRRAIADYPQEVRCWISLSDAMSQLKKYEEAETALKRANVIAPNDWRPPLACARYWWSRSLKSVMQGCSSAPDFGLLGNDAEIMAAARDWLERNRVARSQLAAAEEELAKVAPELAKAVSLGPNEREAWCGCVDFYTVINPTIRWCFCAARGQSLPPSEHPLAEPALAACRRLAQVSPNDPKVLAFAVCWEITAWLWNQKDAGPVSPEQFWKTAPRQSKESAEWCFESLEKLADASQDHNAAQAAYALGVFNGYIFHDFKSAERPLRRAIALEQSNADAWELLILILNMDQRPDDAVSACREFLTFRNTVRSRTIALKTYMAAGQIDRAEQQVKAALALGPDDFFANLAMAAFLIRTNDELIYARPAAGKNPAAELIGPPTLSLTPEPEKEVTWSKIDRHLNKAAMALEKLDNKDFDNYVDYFCTAAIAAGLTGNAKEGCERLHELLELNPDCQRAKEILAVLEGTPNDSGR